ncbi:GAF domain-containing protein [Streptomyces sp. st140]|uniref:GAF domain-containing protein n=1 Tax=Streptomyces sp. st140 TaxID=1828052 RepID=UPI001180F73F|nr:GAF domain-containing protein [Streptomyces sp. st140]
MKQWLAERGIHYLFLLFSAFLGVAVAVVSVWADGAQGADKKLWALIAGVSAFGVVLITHFEKRLVEKGKRRAEDRAIRAEADMTKLYSTTLRPLSDTVKGLTALYATAAPLPSSVSAQTASDLLQKRKEVLDRVLAGAVSLTAPPIGPGFIPRARCSFYLYNAATGGFTLEGTFPGYRPPRAVIDPVGAAHMKNAILGGGGKTFRIDGDQEKHSYLIPVGTGYEAVIAVPVIHGTEEIGILSVDAPSFSDFIDPHVTLMESLANILAASYALR